MQERSLFSKNDFVIKTPQQLSLHILESLSPVLYICLVIRDHF